MATWDDVRRIALDLPETSERTSEGVRQWRVREKLLTWERPLRRADYQALGDTAPDGDILAMWVPDLGVKEVLLSDDPDVFFTTPHFDGYTMILIQLEKIPVPELEELIIEAWLDRAPKRLVTEYLKASEEVREGPVGAGEERPYRGRFSRTRLVPIRKICSPSRCMET
jgi:hypothetical protein